VQRTHSLDKFSPPEPALFILGFAKKILLRTPSLRCRRAFAAQAPGLLDAGSV